MLRTLIQRSSLVPQCVNLERLNLIPKQSAVSCSKFNSTSSTFREIDGFKPVFMNYSTRPVSDTEYAAKLKELNRQEKMNPFFLYLKDQLKNEQMTSQSHKTKLKTIGEKWKSLTESEKKTYIDLVNKSREEIKLEKTKLFSTLNEDQINNLNNQIKEEKMDRKKKLTEFRIKKEKNALNAPKRPKGAFFLYLDTLDRGEAKVQDFARGATAKWKQLAEQDKQKFFDQANEMMEQYKKDYAAWEKEMIRQGKIRLVRKKTLKITDHIQKKLKKTKMAKKKLSKKLAKKKLTKRKTAGKKVKTTQKKTETTNGLNKIKI